MSVVLCVGNTVFMFVCLFEVIKLHDLAEDPFLDTAERLLYNAVQAEMPLDMFRG